MFLKLADPDNCTNSTYSKDWSAPTNSAFRFSILVISIVNTFTNSLSFLIFFTNKRQREPTVRMLLLLLSFNEILFNYGLASDTTIRILLFYCEMSFNSIGAAHNIIYYLTFNWVLGNTFLSARNWCCVLIAASRSEAILRPMSRLNQRQFFTSSRLIKLYCIILVICTFFGCVRSVQDTYFLCPNSAASQWIVAFMELHLPFDYYLKILISGVIFQAAIPICVVTCCTLLMTYALRTEDQGVQLRCNTSRAQRHATRMVQILLVVFVSMELPQFMFFCFNIADIVPGDFRRILMEVGNLLICLDSTFNFVIYVLTSDTFKATITRWMLCRTSSATQSRRQQVYECSVMSTNNRSPLISSAREKFYKTSNIDE